MNNQVFKLKIWVLFGFYFFSSAVAIAFSRETVSMSIISDTMYLKNIRNEHDFLIVVFPNKRYISYHIVKNSRYYIDSGWVDVNSRNYLVYSKFEFIFFRKDSSQWKTVISESKYVKWNSKFKNEFFIAQLNNKKTWDSMLFQIQEIDAKSKKSIENQRAQNAYINRLNQQIIHKIEPKKIGAYFDTIYADSLLQARLNEFRLNLGFNAYEYSRLTGKFISSRNTRIMIKAETVFHPKVDFNNDIRLQENLKLIFEQYNIKQRFLGSGFASKNNKVIAYGEVAASFCTDSDDLTYEELIDHFVQGWWYSLPHRVIIYSEDDRNNVVLGTSIRYSATQNKYYSAANLLYFY